MRAEPAPATVPGAPRPRRRRLLPALVALMLVALGAGLATLLRGEAPWAWGAAPEKSVTTTVPSGAGPAPETRTTVVSDPLAAAGPWVATEDADEQASCRFAEESLWVRRESAGSFRCRGPNRALPGNLRVEVNVRLISPGSCAALWLRFRPYRGYQVRVCESVVLAGTHKDATARALRTFPLDTPVVANGPAARITVSTRDDVLEVTRDGRPVGTLPLTDPEITDGYLVLGIFTEPRAAGHTPPYAVAFNHVDVYGLS